MFFVLKTPFVRVDFLSPRVVASRILQIDCLTTS